GEAVDEAIKTYGSFGTFERVDPAPGVDYWTVRVTAASPSRERKVAGEVANCALGLTVTAKPTTSTTSTTPTTPKTEGTA
ncbi:MAG: hypothetical protein ACRENE_31515, partial [Polyangiaceae bacterium]